MGSPQVEAIALKRTKKKAKSPARKKTKPKKTVEKQLDPMDRALLKIKEWNAMHSTIRKPNDHNP